MMIVVNRGAELLLLGIGYYSLSSGYGGGGQVGSDATVAASIGSR